MSPISIAALIQALMAVDTGGNEVSIEQEKLPPFRGVTVDDINTSCFIHIQGDVGEMFQGRLPLPGERVELVCTHNDKHGIRLLLKVVGGALDLGQEAEEQGRDLGKGEHTNSADNPGGPDSHSHTASNGGNLGKDAIDLTL